MLYTLNKLTSHFFFLIYYYIFTAFVSSISLTQKKIKKKQILSVYNEFLEDI
jgi:hypothetical protein